MERDRIVTPASLDTPASDGTYWADEEACEVQAASRYLSATNFPVGTLCNAREFADSKMWDICVVTGFNDTYTTLYGKWKMSGNKCEIPFTSENVQSLDNPGKRVRKSIVTLSSPRKYKVKPKATASAGAAEALIRKSGRKANDDGRHSATLEEVKLAELTGEKSLSAYIKDLKLFVSSKVYERLRLLSVVESTGVFSKNASSYSAIDKAAVKAETENALLKQPEAIVNVQMREYQRQGMSWLVSQYDKGINSILADEMGLGKTLQTISFISYLKDVRKLSGPHLVVVPLSVLFNWVVECRKFCPTLRIFRLHCTSTKEMPAVRARLADIDGYDVCVTSYEMIKSANSQRMIAQRVWRTIVLDEGHRIKNMLSQISQACMLLRSRFRLILTGTPVQNNLLESFSLLHFLAPKIFESDASSIFESSFALQPGHINVDRKVLDAAHYLMRPFLLRRIKTEVEQKLPPKLETMIKCPLSEMQRFWIRRLLLRDSADIAAAVGVNPIALSAATPVSSSSTSSSTGSDQTPIALAPFSASDAVAVSDTRQSSAWKRLQSLLAQLRKASNHPYLFPGAEGVEDDTTPCGEDIVSASGKMVILDRLLAKLKAKGHRVVLFSQYTRTLDIISDYLDMRAYNHCRLDGSTNRVMREVYINQYNRKDSPLFVFCLSTRAGGEGVNLFTADTVILFDSDWNPQKDIQAMARVHRIGQTKPVHVYRLVSAGSVEERIVERAQKKLFLDSMVNRGSTALGKEIDEKQQKKKLVVDSRKGIIHQDSDVACDEDDDAATTAADNTAAVDEEEDGESAVDLSVMMSALKFGWNACFSASSAAIDQGISDADLEAIIDRTRGLPTDENKNAGTGTGTGTGDSSSYQQQASAARTAPHNNNNNSSSSSSSSNLLVEGVQNSVAEFDESVPFTALRLLEGENINAVRNSTMGDISRQWILQSGRERHSRYTEMKVTNVGKVNILKSNCYSLQEGEPSVFERECAAGSRSYFQEKKRKRNDFANQDQCQICWDVGELLCCDFCPTSFHLKCLGLSALPESTRNIGNLWACPHHLGCIVCDKTKAAAGFIFRCEMCPNTYCEDCLPMDHVFVGVCQRFEELGYQHPGNTCYIHCGHSCAEFYMAGQNLSAADKAITVIRPETSHAVASSGGGGGGSKKKKKLRYGSKKYSNVGEK